MLSIKKTVAIVLLTLFLCTLAIVGVVFLIKNHYETHKATTIMTCSLNPSIKFVINSNNKVITALATNDEGQELLLSNDFENLSIENAAIKFAEMCFKSGFIPTGANLETGKIMRINFDGTLEDYSDLKLFVLDEVNKYFYFNGIIASAIGSITDNLENDLNTIYNLAEKDSKSEDEILQELAQIVEIIKDIPLKDYEEFKELYQEYQTELSNQAKIPTEQLASFRNHIQTLAPIVAEMNDENANNIFNSLENIANTTTIQQLDLAIQNFYKSDFVLDTKIESIVNTMMEDIKAQLKLYKDNFKEFQKNLKKGYNTRFNALVDAHKDTIEQLKNTFNERLVNNKQSIQEHNEYFQQNRNEVHKLIEEFRTLQSA